MRNSHAVVQEDFFRMQHNFIPTNFWTTFIYMYRQHTKKVQPIIQTDTVLASYKILHTDEHRNNYAKWHMGENDQEMTALGSGK